MNRFLPLFIAALAASLPVFAQDAQQAKDIFGPCAACHGDSGQGGKRGEYPRIAGQSAKYMFQQLKNFQSQARINLPMYPYTKERDIPDTDMKLVSSWLEQVELSTEIPDFKDTDDALTRLTAMDKVMIISRAVGDIEHGGAVYQKNCAACHGKTGKGKGSFPMLVGQYTNYLQRQVDAFLRAERPHDEESAKEGVLYSLLPQDVQNVLAYLTSIQGK